MNKLIKEFICVALVALVFATLAACGSPAAKPAATEAPQPAAEENSAPAEAEESAESPEVIGMVNPWHEAATAEEAAKGAGLDGFALPDVPPCFPDGFEGPEIRYMNGLAEAEYFCEDNSLLLRKGSGSEDVSGDYNVYAKTWEVESEGLKIQCSGNEDGEKLARWTRDGYSYSLSFNASEAELPGLSEDMVTAIVGLFR